MILKASQRGGSKQLAAHLLKTEENEHVELHEVRGFVSDSLPGALQEAYAVSRGTQCQKFLFSLSLNPPETASVAVEDFEAAITTIEEKLGLTDQPRVTIFHEKQGRRHCHCVWSRIDHEEMKAIKLPYYKMRLRDVSRELYLTHGWKMPKGLVNSEERDPSNFSQAEWQQAKRAGRDPKVIKEVLQDCWAISDSHSAFAHALEERGYYLAKGDRRGFVAVDYQGEIYSVAKWAGVKTKDVTNKFGSPEKLPSVDQTKSMIAARMTTVLKRYIADVDTTFKSRSAIMERKQLALVGQHRDARKSLREKQQNRWAQETKTRVDRLPKGLRGLWSRLTGRYGKIRKSNEVETAQSHERDRSERQNLIQVQLSERQALQRTIRRLRQRHARDLTELNRDVAHYMRMSVTEQQRALSQTGQKKKPRRRRGPTIH